MMTLSRLAGRATLFLAATVPAALHAQTGTITGRVVDAESAAPLQNAAVQVLGAADAQEGGVLTDASGRFRFTVPPGTHSIVVSLIGYETARVDGVSVEAGETEDVTIPLTSRAFALNPVIVTASRRQEKALEAPASVAIVGQEAIREEAAPTVVEHVKGLAGVDIVQTGLQQSNVVARGFNNVFSGALLVLTDNRYASVPSLRFNAYNMIPATSLDLERVEVVLGPGAALYGPNSASGVMHLITTSPIDDPGTSMSLAGGTRSVFHGVFRHATRVSDAFGFKVSGQYFAGDDWQFVDPVEQADREDAIEEGADPDTLLIGARNFDAERWSVEARADYRPWDDGEVIFSGGVNAAVSSIEMTGIGGAQADDWRYSYLQGRVRKGRLFGQAFVNMSDAGSTYLLRTGEPIIDESRLWVSQLQHGLDLGDRQSFTYGLDFQYTQPRTEATITGRNEDDDNILELGGYLHSETDLAERLGLVAALRVDHHSELQDLVVSPRAAVVFRPDEQQNVRFTYNRAFSTPTTNNLFLDLVAGRIPVGGLVDYPIRTLGVPESGFTFTDECPGGVQDLCMYSPFAPSPDLQLPASGVPLWDGLVDALLPPQLAPALKGPGTQPGDPELGAMLRRFNQEAAQSGEGDPFPPDPEGPQAIPRIQPTITNTFELGYKGLIGDRLLLSADIYTNQVKDFIGPLRVETPTVFFDPATVQAFVLKRLGPLIQAGLVTQEQATQIITDFSRLPLGTVAPDQVAGTDVLLTYRNFGDVDFWGADVAGELIATDRVRLRGSYSYVSQDCFQVGTGAETDCNDPLDIALNAPQHKGSVGARFDDDRVGFTAEARVRFTAGFPMNSGVYVGDVEGYTILDANVGYQLPMAPGATVTLTATNLFDDEHREFVGAPRLGRLLLLRLQYDF